MKRMVRQPFLKLTLAFGGFLLGFFGSNCAAVSAILGLVDQASCSKSDGSAGAGSDSLLHDSLFVVQVLIIQQISWCVNRYFVAKKPQKSPPK
jgi:hypothetical protein